MATHNDVRDELCPVDRTADAGTSANYDARSIVVFSGLAAVRRNPSMYVGSTGAEGLHQLVFELIDNATDEAVAGYCTELSVVLHEDESCSVSDDGRGVPIDVHPQTGRPACEVVLTTLHAGGKFQGDSYATSAGLHGVGLSCVNALSAWLWLDVWRDGVHVRQRYSRGTAAGELAQVGVSGNRGTRIRFRPDPEIFGAERLSADTVAERLAEVAFLHPGLRVRLLEERTGRTESYHELGGVRGLLEFHNREAVPVHPHAIEIAGRDGEVVLDIAVRWTEGYTEEIRSFVNGVRTDQGGAHVDGLRVGLAAAINRYATTRGLLDGFVGERITTTDVLEGLTAVVSVRMEAPRFDGQTKKRLQNPEIGRTVQTLAERSLWRRLSADAELGEKVVGRALDATRARLAARLAGRTARYRKRELRIDYEVYRRQFGIRSRNWHDSCSWLTDEGLLAEHAALCGVPPDARMLDVCCGSGVVGASFRDKVGESVGLDITPEMVRLASDRLDRVDQGTVYELPYPDASFDLVVNREVLHLLPQPEKPVSEIFRVLRPGGQFIVGQIVPYADEDAFWMFRIFKKKQPLLFQMFSEQDFRALLLGAGFTAPRMTEYFLWESIDRWIDTHETTPAHRQEIYRLYYDAPREVRAVHPFEVGADGSVRDRWRWCVYSVRKPSS
jgi:DNA gyrase subunit B